MTVKVHLISQYKNYRMLTNTRKLEFRNGVCVVEFQSADEANNFVKAIAENPALTPYCRVSTMEGAAAVSASHEAQASQTGIKVGAQTSEVPPQLALTTSGVTQQMAFAQAEENPQSREVATQSREGSNDGEPAQGDQSSTEQAQSASAQLTLKLTNKGGA